MKPARDDALMRSSTIERVFGVDMPETVLAEADHQIRGMGGDLTPAEATKQVRRFMELWICDGRFREALLMDARAAAAARGFTLDPEQLRVFWDRDFGEGIEDLPPAEALKRITPLGLIWIELRERSSHYTKLARSESVPSDPRFAAWRENQIARCALSLHPRMAAALAHIPFAIELSKGCSVGCWFCGVSAPRLDGHFRHSKDNAVAFRTMLAALNRVAGAPAGKWGILYWATDPFDHPDYELFCQDFAEAFGAFPVTTTAQGWKDLPRTRDLIRRTASSGHARVRLSTLNLRILNRYLAELSPQELASVAFVPVNKESLVRIAEAGQARHQRPESWSTSAEMPIQETTIACVSGFLINLVDRTVKLISPCPSSETWPDGYIVHDQRQYGNADYFGVLLEEMIQCNMQSGARGVDLATT